MRVRSAGSRRWPRAGALRARRRWAARARRWWSRAARSRTSIPSTSSRTGWWPGEATLQGDRILVGKEFAEKYERLWLRATRSSSCWPTDRSIDGNARGRVRPGHPRRPTSSRCSRALERPAAALGRPVGRGQRRGDADSRRLRVPGRWRPIWRRKFPRLTVTDWQATERRTAHRPAEPEHVVRHDPGVRDHRRDARASPRRWPSPPSRRPGRSASSRPWAWPTAGPGWSSSTRRASWGWSARRWASASAWRLIAGVQPDGRERRLRPVPHRTATRLRALLGGHRHRPSPWSRPSSPTARRRVSTRYEVIQGA